MWDLFNIGFFAGLALAIPVGPMAIMLINTTVSRGYSHGVVGALGMATVDGLYALTVFAIGALVSGWLQAYGFWLSLVGAGILIALGLQTVFRNLRLLKVTNATEPELVGVASVTATFGRFVAATAVNPPTALYFLAIAPGVSRLGFSFTLESAIWFAVAVFLGSVVWQEALVVLGQLVRTITTNRVRAWIGLFGGLAIIGLAVSMATRAFL